MTDNKKSEPAKGSARPGAGGPGQGPGQAKRPTPTIELQATEIERRDLPGAKAEAGKAPAGAAGGTGATGQAAKPEAAAAPSKPEQAKTAAAGLASPAGQGGTSGAQEATDKSKAGSAAAGQGAGEQQAAAGRAGGPGQPPRPPRTEAASARPRGGVIGGVLSHLAAGLAGGALMLFGADYAANTFGIEIPTASAPQLERLAGRIGALEQEAQEQRQDLGSSALRERVDRLEGQLGGLAGNGKALEEAANAQKAVAAKVAALEAIIAKQGEAAGQLGTLDARLAKLEETLRTMATVGDQGQGGRLPQVAALLARVEQVEQQLDSGLLALKKSLTDDLQKQSARVEERLAETSKDMTLETLKASGKRLSEEIVGLKTDAEKLRQEIATVQGGNAQIRDELASLQQLAQSLKSDLQGQIGTLVKTEQLAGVTALMGKLEQQVAALVGSEQSRAQGANRILLSLELASLKRAIERGAPFAGELAQVRQLAPEGIDLGILATHAATGLPTAAALSAEFQQVADAALDAEQADNKDATLLDTLLSGARSVVRVRKTGDVPGDGTEAILARTEARLQAGDLDGAQRESAALKGPARDAARPWLERLAARLEVDKGLAAIEAGLKGLMSQAGTN